MTIQIGHVSVDPRVLDKRSNFATSETLTIEIHDNCDIKKPVFLLDVSHVSAGYNYAYVPSWGIYYFLSEPVIMDGVRATVTGSIDYLTTYADGIKNLHGYLARTQDAEKSNKFIRDTKPVQQNRRCKTLQFNRSPFTANFATDIVYLLTVVGGDHS